MNSSVKNIKKMGVSFDSLGVKEVLGKLPQGTTGEVRNKVSRIA